MLEQDRQTRNLSNPKIDVITRIIGGTDSKRSLLQTFFDYLMSLPPQNSSELEDFAAFYARIIAGSSREAVRRLKRALNSEARALDPILKHWGYNESDVRRIQPLTLGNPLSDGSQVGKIMFVDGRELVGFIYRPLVAPPHLRERHLLTQALNVDVDAEGDGYNEGTKNMIALRVMDDWRKKSDIGRLSNVTRGDYGLRPIKPAKNDEFSKELMKEIYQEMTEYAHPVIIERYQVLTPSKFPVPIFQANVIAETGMDIPRTELSLNANPLIIKKIDPQFVYGVGEIKDSSLFPLVPIAEGYLSQIRRLARVQAKQERRGNFLVKRKPSLPGIAREIEQLTSINPDGIIGEPKGALGRMLMLGTPVQLFGVFVNTVASTVEETVKPVIEAVVANAIIGAKNEPLRKVGIFGATSVRITFSEQGIIQEDLHSGRKWLVDSQGNRIRKISHGW